MLATSPVSTLTSFLLRTSTRRPDCRRKSALMMGCVTRARMKGHRKDDLPMRMEMIRSPKVEIGVPLAAMRSLSFRWLEETSAGDAGKTLTAAPVSIRKLVPLCLSAKRYRLDWGLPGDAAARVAWHWRFPVFRRGTGVDNCGLRAQNVCGSSRVCLSSLPGQMSTRLAVN